MCATFTDDDVGKRVETASGDALGVVTMVEADTIYVRANEGAIDAVKSVLDWDAETDETVSIDAGAVADVTPAAIRLEDAADRSSQGGTDPVIDRDESTESDYVNGERRDVGAGAGEPDAEDLSEGEGRSGKGVQPETDAMTESGEDRHPDEEAAADEDERPPEGDRTVTKDRGREDDR